MGTGKPRLRWYVAYLENLRDRRDDYPIKVRAFSISDARERVSYNEQRYQIGGVYGIKDFLQFHPDWRGLV